MVEHGRTEAMAPRECPICGRNDRSRLYAEEAYDPERLGRFAFASRKRPEYMHYRLLRCAACDLLYASPAPSHEELIEAYRSADYDSSPESRAAAYTYSALVKRMVDRLPDRAGALDIGAGDGAFLQQLLACRFTDVVGVEPSAAPIAAADVAVRPRIRQGPFRAQDFVGQRFRLITCFQVLEHVLDPLQLCREAYSLLKEGGALLIVVHNWRALSARLLGLRSPIYDIEHMQLFSKQSARLLLQTAGFHDVKSSVMLNRYRAGYWLKLFPLPGRLKTILIGATAALGIGRLPVALPAGNLAILGFKTKAENN
jgi:SAM-dependent methyltransferase